MKNEEITLVIILLIVVIIAVLILSLTPAETNPKNLTVDSAQLTQSTQKAKPGDPVVRSDKLNIKRINRCGLIALLTISLIVIIGVVSQLSETGESAQKDQVGMANQLSESQNTGDKPLIFFKTPMFIIFEITLIAYAFMGAIACRYLRLAFPGQTPLNATGPVIEPTDRLAMTTISSGTITYGIAIGIGSLIAVPNIIGIIMIIAILIAISTIAIRASNSNEINEMDLSVLIGIVVALGFIIGSLHPSVIQ